MCKIRVFDEIFLVEECPVCDSDAFHIYKTIRATYSTAGKQQYQNYCDETYNAECFKCSAQLSLQQITDCAKSQEEK